MKNLSHAAQKSIQNKSKTWNFKDARGRDFKIKAWAKIFWKFPQITHEIIPRMNNWDEIKLKRLYTAKETITGVQKAYEIVRWWGIFNYCTSEGSHLEYITAEIKWQKINQIISKYDNELKRNFSKEEIEATSKLLQRVLNVLHHQGNTNYSYSRCLLPQSEWPSSRR